MCLKICSAALEAYPCRWTSVFGDSFVFMGLVSYYIYYILVAAQMPLIAITGKSVFFNALEDYDGDGCLGLCVGYRGGSSPMVYMDTINAAGTPVTGSQKVITPTAEQVTGEAFPLQDFGDLTWDMVKSNANGDVWLDRVFQLVRLQRSRCDERVVELLIIHMLFNEDRPFGCIVFHHGWNVCIDDIAVFQG